MRFILLLVRSIYMALFQRCASCVVGTPSHYQVDRVVRDRSKGTWC